MYLILIYLYCQLMDMVIVCLIVLFFIFFQEIWTESDHMLLLSKSAGIMIEPS